MEKLSLTEIGNDFNLRYGVCPTPFDAKHLSKAVKLAADEVQEAKDEVTITPFSVHNAAKELVDNIYVTIQQLVTMGVDVDKAILEVHRSNLSKLVKQADLANEINVARERYFDVEAHEMMPGYFRLYSPSLGKVVKPTTYSPADITGALDAVRTS